MLSELFTRMQYEPSILMLGKKYRSISLSVLDYTWNCVVTTNCEMKLATTLSNGKRTVKEVMSKDDMQANLIDRRNLHIIRLFGESYPEEAIDELDAEDITDQAVSKLARITEIIQRNGIILIEDFEESLFSHKEFRKAFRNLFVNQKQVYIFNCIEKDQYLASLEKQGIAVILEQSINDYFEEYFVQGSDSEYESTDNAIGIYIDAEESSALKQIEKRSLIETESFATLLNVELLNSVRIPENMYKDYFYIFLKNSAREPQWFGYHYGFNIHRDFETTLYKKVKKGLENIGKPNNKPLLLVGQTGTGKSIAIAAVAYKIFNEKKYPVIYINDPDVNFYSHTEYKNKDIEKKGSPSLNALDSLIDRLEKLGAKAVLLVWDTSSYSTGREKCYKLYQTLRARARKVFMLSTAYEMNNQNNISEEDENTVEDSVMNKKFIECRAEVTLTNEADQLTDIMLNKCKMPPKEVHNIVNYYARSSSNYLSMIYQAFDILREDLSEGVFKEAKASLQELDKILQEGNVADDSKQSIFAIALKKVESDLLDSGILDNAMDFDAADRERIEVAKEDFIKCIAVCSQYKLKMPYDFSLRILGTYNGKIIRTLSKSTFFLIDEDYHGNYEISFRTPNEATMYMFAKGMVPMDEIDCIIKMLDMMSPSSEYGQQQEVRLCEKLVRIIGPNNHDSRIKYKYKKGYGSIIEALRRLRTEHNIWEPILISQEITFLREYYGRDESLDISSRIRALNEAIEIANSVLNRTERQGVSIGVRNAIIVESANSKLLLCQLRESKDSLTYKELRRDLRNVIRYDNMNYHAYVTYLKGSVTEYQNETDQIKKLELLEAMCTAADEIVFENPEIANSEYFQRQVTEIYSYLDDTTIVNSYIDELVSNGSSAGLYVWARKILLENKVDFKKPISNLLQQSACKKVYELFTNDKYRIVAEGNESCQYMLINVIWLMNNKKPIFMEGECWITSMREEVWKELLVVCNNFILNFYSDNESSQQFARNIKYIQALCMGELGQYIESLAVLRSIKEDSSLGIGRVYTKHMLCDENGKIRVFTGRLGKYNEVERTGEVFIEEFGKTPIYYFGPHLKWSGFEEGTVFTDIEIGYSNIAPKAFRQIENKG